MISVVIAAGSNLGDRRRHLREAIFRLRTFLSVVRVSPLFETEPLNAPPGSPPFLNLVVAGFTDRNAASVLQVLHSVEEVMGRRRGAPNAPRTIDLDLILHGSTLARTSRLTVPHPRFALREFVLAPLRALELPWLDPTTGTRLGDLRGSGNAQAVGPLFGSQGRWAGTQSRARYFTFHG